MTLIPKYEFCFVQAGRPILHCAHYKAVFWATDPYIFISFLTILTYIELQ